MMLTAELQLAGLILVLYFQDAVLLLHMNEGVLTFLANGEWKLNSGATNTRVMGKNVFVPNLLAVHRPHYRMRWSLEAGKANAGRSAVGKQTFEIKSVKQRTSNLGAKDGSSFPGDFSNPLPANWVPQTDEFKWLGRLTLLVGFIQLVAFPAVMFLYQTDTLVIAILVAIYSTVLLALLLVRSKRDTFRLSGKKFAGLCFECLICPPIAINLVRRLSMDMCSTSDLVAVAGRLLAADAWSEAQQTLRKRVEDQMSLEPQDSIRYAALQRRLEDLSSKRSDFDEYQ